jgi:hypothetical protein
MELLHKLVPRFPSRILKIFRDKAQYSTQIAAMSYNVYYVFNMVSIMNKEPLPSSTRDFLEYIHNLYRDQFSIYLKDKGMNDERISAALDLFFDPQAIMELEENLDLISLERFISRHDYNTKSLVAIKSIVDKEMIILKQKSTVSGFDKIAKLELEAVNKAINKINPENLDIFLGSDVEHIAQLVKPNRLIMDYMSFFSEQGELSRKLHESNILTSFLFSILFKPPYPLFFFFELSKSNLDIDKKISITQGLFSMLYPDTDSELWKGLAKKIFSLEQKNFPPFINSISVPRFIADTLSVLFNPTLINQEKGTCGVVVYLQFLIKYFPDQFVDFALNLYREGKSETPFHIYMNLEELVTEVKKEGESEEDILNHLMFAIRNTTNKVLSYSSKASPFIEKIRGSTSSEEIQAWIKKSGGEISSNSVGFVTKDFRPIHPFFQSLLGGSSQLNPGKVIETIQTALNEKKSCFVQLSSPLTNKIDIERNFNKDRDYLTQVTLTENDKLPEPMELFTIQYTHFITVHELRNDEQNKNLFHVKLDSWGTLFELTMPKSMVEKNFIGCIVADKKQELSLEERSNRDMSM